MSLSEDNLEDLIPGAKLTHLLTIVADDALQGLKAVVDALDRQGATLHAVNVGQLGPGSVQRLRIGGLKAEAARAFARQLEDLPAISRASVEHHVSREVG